MKTLRYEVTAAGRAALDDAALDERIDAVACAQAKLGAAADPNEVAALAEAMLLDRNAEPSREAIAAARRAARKGDPTAWRWLCARYPVWNENGGSADAWADDSQEYAR